MFQKEATMDTFNILIVIALGILLCFNKVECDCYRDYQQCFGTFKQVTRPPFKSTSWTSFCSAADTLDSCLKNDVTSCGPDATEPENYTLYVATAADSKKSCKVVDCATKDKKCAASLESNPKCTDIKNYNKLTLAEGVNCCKIGSETKTCIQNCGDSNIIISDPVLQQSDELCRGYNDYCPGMYSCFLEIYQKDGFNDAAAVCRNIDGFIGCIKSKCANKPEIGQRTLTKIREVFKEICGVFGKYTSVALCQSFKSCIEKAPSLPGMISGNIPSFISARNSDRWCKIAKFYVSCGVKATEDNSCTSNQGVDFNADVTKLQTYTDNACTGVRGPCVEAFYCSATLKGSYFKTICPNIPGFVTCTENALKTCGEGSRVQADYSLLDIKDLYVETCQAMTGGLYQCSLMNTCLDLQLPSNTGDMIDELSDQTSWCRKLHRMLKCTTDVSTACQQPKTVHDKFMMIYKKVFKLCDSPVYRPPTLDNNSNGAGAIRVVNVIFPITVFLVMFT